MWSGLSFSGYDMLENSNASSEKFQLQCAVESNLKSFGNEANILIIINLFFRAVGRCENPGASSNVMGIICPPHLEGLTHLLKS